MSISKFFTQVANTVSHQAGRPLVFIAACATIIIWGLSGPLFRFSDTWQLVINTGTTIITFLMVFLIQNTQNRDSAALHSKLDELIRVGRAQNSYIGIEHLTEEEIERIRDACEASVKDIGGQAVKTQRKKKAADIAAKILGLESVTARGNMAAAKVIAAKVGGARSAKKRTLDTAKS